MIKPDLILRMLKRCFERPPGGHLIKPFKNMEKTPGVKLRYARKSGTTCKLQLKLWRACEAAEAMLYADGITFDDQVRALHALVQAGATYGKLLETVDLQAQLEALREELREVKQSQGLRKVG